MATQDFQTVFTELKSIMHTYEATMYVIADAPDNYVLDTQHLGPNGKRIFFGAVKTSKTYVSFHLMPVYMFPDLLDGISPELHKHMQGKSCFNFKTADKALFKELAVLTKKSVARMKQKNVL